MVKQGTRMMVLRIWEEQDINMKSFRKIFNSVFFEQISAGGTSPGGTSTASYEDPGIRRRQEEEEPEEEEEESEEPEQEYEEEPEQEEYGEENPEQGQYEQEEAPEPMEPSDLLKMYELRRIYKKLVNVLDIIESINDPEIYDLRKNLLKSIEYLDIIIDNLDNYKEKLDDLLQLYHKYLKSMVQEIVKFRKKSVR